MGKLVRDRIPEIIRDEGGEPQVRVLQPSEYRAALLDKLVEESLEAQVADAEHLLEELADVWEVLLALGAACGWPQEVIAHRAEAKRHDRGGFTERLYLD